MWWDVITEVNNIFSMLVILEPPAQDWYTVLD